jgi:site-specific DNA-cytosine methylase
MVLWGEREVALNRLMPLGPFTHDVSWDELPQACMAMDAEHWGLLGNSRWVQRGEPRGFGDYLLELDDQWDWAIAVEPMEGQPKPPLRTKLEGWVTVLCLFAGIGAELEGLLKAGIRVRKLLVVEVDPVARRILEYRVRCLHRRYPDQLPAVACEGLLTAMPADIRLVGSTEVERFMPIHVVTVSSPCQGLSCANRNGRGLADPRSELIGEAWRILTYLSKHQSVKPAYTFEMVDARDHPSQDAKVGFTIIDRVARGAVDTAVVINAAKLGSAAHRVRAFWTNAVPSRTLKQRYAQFDREWVNDRKEAQDVLRNGRRVNTDPDIKGYYRMNFEGEPIRVFPTLVATPQSFAFRRQEGGPIPGRPGPGMVYDPEMRGWMEPTVDERELIMGLLSGSTRAPGVEEDQRRAAIGAAIDVRAYYWLWRKIRR